MNDLISRRKAFEYFVALWECIGTIMDRDEWEDVCMTTANEIPSEQPEAKPIEYRDCANAMLKMWMDNVVTDGEYYRIMDKLNAYWRK